MKKTILNIKDLNVYYGNFHAIKNISMEIYENAATAFIGPSGCGKSTFIRSLNRMNELLPGTTINGHIEYGGKNINAPEENVSEIRKKIGMVFQKPNPFPKSIYENIAWGARINGYKGDLNYLVEESLRKAVLWDEVKDKLHKSAYQLSGGQQQRLCIARTIAIEPQIILMDEPTSALDPIATGRIEDLILELKKNYTIAIVTHNIAQAGRVSDYTAFFLIDEFKTGYLVEYDTTEALFMNPSEKSTELYLSGKFG